MNNFGLDWVEILRDTHRKVTPVIGALTRDYSATCPAIEVG